ncbi:MAG: hypothetical protein U0821_26550 [Chloroflexota bacterium]
MADAANFPAGTVSGFADPSAYDEFTESLEPGHRWTQREWQHLAQSLLQVLRDEGAGTILFTDYWRSSSSDHVANDPGPVSYLGDEVLWWLDLNATPLEDVARQIGRRGSQYPSVSFVVRQTPEQLGLANHQQVATDLPERVADSLGAIFVGISDEESVAYWLPR